MRAHGNLTLLLYFDLNYICTAHLYFSCRCTFGLFLVFYLGFGWGLFSSSFVGGAKCWLLGLFYPHAQSYLDGCDLKGAKNDGERAKCSVCDVLSCGNIIRDAFNIVS